MLKKILDFKTSVITTSAFILAFATFGSALLGLLRDRLLAGRFGAGEELDIYFAAFRIPDFIAMVLIMGAISAAIVPVFSSYWLRDKKEAWRFTATTLNLFLVFLIFISLILFIFAPFIVSLIAPGFAEGKKELTVTLTRIMFLSPILLGISNIISGILQVFHRFLVTSLAPIMYNLGIISGILFFVPLLGISGLAWGVVFGGFLHLLIQIPIFLSVGFRPRKILDFFHPGFQKVIKLMIPRSIGLASSQFNLIVITAIGSTLAAGSIAVFNLAHNLSQFLITIIAVSFSTAVFPSLAMIFSQGNKEEFINKFSSVFRQVLYLIIPLSALLFILRAQMVKVILGTGQFDWLDTRLTTACLGIFALGMLAYGLVILFSKAFYALQNTKIPSFLSIATMIVNVGLVFLFVWLLKFPNFFQEFLISNLKLRGIESIAVVGLPLAFSIAGIFQLSLLIIFLYKKIGDFRLGEVWRSFQKIVLATLIMAVVTYFIRNFIPELINTKTFLGVFIQAIMAGLIGFLIYFLATCFLKSPEIKNIKFLIGRYFTRY